LQAAVYGFSASLGFSLVMVLFAGMRERLVLANVPAPFKGNSIALVTAGLMALAFMGFTGLVKF
jgi:electron transport complex protein RnfA